MCSSAAESEEARRARCGNAGFSYMAVLQGVQMKLLPHFCRGIWPTMLRCVAAIMKGMRIMLAGSTAAVDMKRIPAGSMAARRNKAYCGAECTVEGIRENEAA